MAQAPTTRAIVAGVDGSPESLAAAVWAARAAALRGLPLRLVHAWLWEPLDVPLEQDRETEARRAQGVLDEAEAEVCRLHPGVPVTSRLVSDTPVSALLEAGGEAEMLVIGSSGRGALLGFLLGSHGQRVIAASTRPVVAVRARRDDGAEPVSYTH
ncbi:universal stress protein, partial [Streptomyces sp. Act-28]